MVEKFGSDQSQLATFGGGVISEDGAVLLSGESTGSTASLAGPALVREQQTMIANGDWTIPPADPYATITADNPLPYWTFVDNTGNGKVTCALVFDGNAGSQKRLRWNVAITAGSSSASISRFVYIPASGQRAFAYVPELYVSGQSSGSNSTITLAYQYYKLDQTTTTGTGDSVSATINTMSGQTLGFSANATRFSAPSDAAFMLITITVAGTTSAGFSQQVDVAEVRLVGGPESFLVAESTTPDTYAPTKITQTNGALSIAPNYTGAGSVAVTGSLTATTDIGFDGVIYGSSALTGIALNVGGTNNRLWIHSSPAADVAASTSTTVSGVLITKVTAGQPSTNINGTATTDAFADALRNGGIAVDTTNNRAYFYSSGWKYAALTTPSDSRLKEDITSISDALGKLKQLVPVAFKWKRPEAHARAEAVDDDGSRLGFIADQVATTDLKHWVETLGVDDREADLVDTTEVLAVNIPQNEIEALIVQALIDIDARITALESR